MTVRKTSKTEFAIDSDDNKSFVFGNYTTTWPTNRTYYNVLKVAVNDIDGYIHRSNGGLHNAPQVTFNFKGAILIIDPETGKVIDLKSPNYFYDYIYKHHSSFIPSN